MVTADVLRHRIVHVLGLLVLQLHRDDRQAVEKEAEIRALAALDEQFRNKGDPVLGVESVGDALAGAGFGEVEFEVVTAHAQAAAEDRPQGAAANLLAQCLENLVAGVAAVVLF